MNRQRQGMANSFSGVTYHKNSRIENPFTREDHQNNSNSTDSIGEQWHERSSQTAVAPHCHPNSDLFEYVGDVDDELECMICNHPVWQPLFHECGRIFGRECFNSTFQAKQQCPNCFSPENNCSSIIPLPTKNKLNGIKVRCKNCKLELLRVEYADHMQYCAVNLSEQTISLNDFHKLKNDVSQLISTVNSLQDTIFSMKVDSLVLDEKSRMKELGASRDVLMMAVKRSGNALQYASDVLKDDRELVMQAVAQQGMALGYASDALKDDKELVMQAVKQNAYALSQASNRLKDDKEMVLTAVKNCSGHLLNSICSLLQYVSERLKDDKDVVWEFVRVDPVGNAILYASPRLKRDEQLIQETRKKRPDIDRQLNYTAW